MVDVDVALYFVVFVVWHIASRRWSNRVPGAGTDLRVLIAANA